MRKWLIAAVIAAALGSASPAVADRAPTEIERAAIEQVLRAQGFLSWEDIALDEDHWEVNNARAPDGKVYDLLLDGKTLQIAEQELDNGEEEDDD